MKYFVKLKNGDYFLAEQMENDKSGIRENYSSISYKEIFHNVEYDDYFFDILAIDIEDILFIAKYEKG